MGHSEEVDAGRRRRTSSRVFHCSSTHCGVSGTECTAFFERFSPRARVVRESTSTHDVTDHESRWRPGRCIAAHSTYLLLRLGRQEATNQKRTTSSASTASPYLGWPIVNRYPTQASAQNTEPSSTRRAGGWDSKRSISRLMACLLFPIRLSGTYHCRIVSPSVPKWFVIPSSRTGVPMTWWR